MKKMFCEGYKIFLVVILLSLITILNFSSCQTTEPPVTQGKIILESLDASSTEAWLKLSVQELSLPQNVTFTRNDTIIENITIDKSDTVFYDEGLLPNQNYKYRAIIQSASQSSVNNQSILSSDIVSVTTMDTTSHDFTWQTYTFGDGSGGNSYLKDVAIINENDIWAVGEIYENGKDYNAVHWNGEAWELTKIGGYGYPGYNTVYAFNENDVWFDGTIQWDGFRYSAHINNFPLEPNGDGWRVYGMWGTSSSDFYIVGEHGNIAHYDGASWEKIESGTELRFYDISGDNVEIYCIAAALFTGINSELYEIKNDTSFLIDGTNLGISSVTVYPIREKLYVFGYYRFVRTEGKYGWEEISEPVNFDGYSKIRGVGYNDIVAVGSFGKVYHYNGKSWNLQRIRNDINNLIDFTSVAIKNNIICAVGSNNIALGRR